MIDALLRQQNQASDLNHLQPWGVRFIQLQVSAVFKRSTVVIWMIPLGVSAELSRHAGWDESDTIYPVWRVTLYKHLFLFSGSSGWFSTGKVKCMSVKWLQEGVWVGVFKPLFLWKFLTRCGCAHELSSCPGCEQGLLSISRFATAEGICSTSFPF